MGAIVAFLLYVAGGAEAFGWYLGPNLSHAVGLIALGLAVELLGAPVPALPRPGRRGGVLGKPNE